MKRTAAFLLSLLLVLTAPQAFASTLLETGFGETAYTFTLLHYLTLCYELDNDEATITPWLMTQPLESDGSIMYANNNLAFEFGFVPNAGMSGVAEIHIICRDREMFFSDALHQQAACFLAPIAGANNKTMSLTNALDSVCGQMQRGVYETGDVRVMDGVSIYGYRSDTVFVIAIQFSPSVTEDDLRMPMYYAIGLIQ